VWPIVLSYCCYTDNEEELVQDEDDIGDMMAEILAEEQRKKAELQAQVQEEVNR